MTEENIKKIKELEKELSYLVNDKMTTDQKLKKLSGAYSEAWNSGYGDAMANKLMSGIEDEQTRMWERNCENKYKISALIDLLKASTEETEGEEKC